MKFFLVIPTYFKIEILAIQDEFVLLGHKGLSSRSYCTSLVAGILQHKDRDIARLCEEKEACLADILAEMGQVEPPNPYPNYRAFLDEHSIEPSQARELQIKAINVSLKPFVAININIIKIFALKNFKINIHQNVSRAFNILHYQYHCLTHRHQKIWRFTMAW